MGFKVDAWDYLTFAILLLSIVIFLWVLVLVLGLPGRIAIARRHPDAESVNLMGWLGFMAVIPWIQAFMWAFKPTDVIDIRRYPERERLRIREMIDKLKGEPEPPSAATKAPAESSK
jgi:Protein of unknown function (DUF3302)